MLMHAFLFLIFPLSFSSFLNYLSYLKCFSRNFWKVQRFLECRGRFRGLPVRVKCQSTRQVTNGQTGSRVLGVWCGLCWLPTLVSCQSLAIWMNPSSYIWFPLIQAFQSDVMPSILSGRTVRPHFKRASVLSPCVSLVLRFRVKRNDPLAVLGNSSWVAIFKQLTFFTFQPEYWHV